jgi:hypothetical protein
MRCFNVAPSRHSHDDVEAVLVLADIVNRADVGVVEGGGGTGFALESLAGLRVLGQRFGQELEGYATAEAPVFGFIDHSHTPTA